MSQRFGIAFLLVAVLGLATTGATMEASMDPAPRLLGGFPVNLLHNLIHLAFGVSGLLAGRGEGGG